MHKKCIAAKLNYVSILNGSIESFDGELVIILKSETLPSSGNYLITNQKLELYKRSLLMLLNQKIVYQKGKSEGLISCLNLTNSRNDLLDLGFEPTKDRLSKWICIFFANNYLANSEHLKIGIEIRLSDGVNSYSSFSMNL